MDEFSEVAAPYSTGRIKESDEVRPGVIADFGHDGGVVGFEVLDASKVFGPTREVVLDGLESAASSMVLHDKPVKYGRKK